MWDFHTQIEFYSLNVGLGTQETTTFIKLPLNLKNNNKNPPVFVNIMEVKCKQWSVDETNCLLALWSSREIQNKLEGASRTKPVIQQIQCEMAPAGFDRGAKQTINKLKKLRKRIPGIQRRTVGEGDRPLCHQS